MRTAYPSDITREQFEVIRDIIESSKKKTHPPDYELYDIFCVVLYRKREGCRWRSLPHDFPKWQNCYYHYNEWRKSKEGGESVLDRIMCELVESERIMYYQRARTADHDDNRRLQERQKHRHR